MTSQSRESHEQYRDHACDSVPEQYQLACDQGVSSNWRIWRDLGRMEAYQLQSPSRRVSFQILPEIEVSCKVKYEREWMFCGAIDPNKRYDVPV